MSAPLNVWYSDGVTYVDYRLDDGRIVTRAGIDGGRPVDDGRGE